VTKSQNNALETMPLQGTTGALNRTLNNNIVINSLVGTPENT